MNNFKELIRENILSLEPYKSAREEYKGKEALFLDANESPFGYYNRYPDPFQIELKKRLAQIKRCSTEQLFIGNGSDEVIDIAFRLFCEPKRDKALIFSPTYGVYKVLAQLNNVELINIPLNNEFQIEIDKVYPYLNDVNLKLIIICSPNNPTGNRIEEKAIKYILNNFRGVTLIDEAYIEFSNKPSLSNELANYPNLIISQTLSKAWGLASLRIGVAIMNPNLIYYYNKIKSPYNISEVNQSIALKELQDQERHKLEVEEIVKERNWLIGELSKIKIIKKVYPSESNFILIETEDPRELCKLMESYKIVLRNRDSDLRNSVRITVGNREQNRKLVLALQEIESAPTGARRAVVERKTLETDISILLNLDGNGNSSIESGLPFLDHMLHQIAKHANIDLRIVAQGDLMIDEHHTIEDTALALGMTFSKALGNNRAIQRYGFLLPMDDSLAQVAIDFGGRPSLVWDVEFARESIGGIPTELFYHFFHSFCDQARCTLNIKATGDNEHHKIEAIFKSFAKSLEMAVKAREDNQIPSTKGVI